jgi:hypothetical protein
MLSTNGRRNSIERFEDLKTFRFQEELNLSEGPLPDVVGIVGRTSSGKYFPLRS